MAKEFEKDFPWSLSKTKTEGLNKEFNLSQLSKRHQYFKAKVGKEIEGLKQYLDKNTFIAYWLGKKNSGKGTYSKLMLEIFGKDRINHVSVGDVVREACEKLKDPKQREEIVDYLKKNYRGYISVDEAVESILNRDTKSLLPTEFILTLVKREIDKMPKKSLFIDGFPRNMDQVSYSLYFRDLINYREDPDVFIGIDIPEQVIDQRMKSRVVCPKCHTPRSLKLLPTQEVGYDPEKKEFYLMCDDPDCDKARMTAKEGDNLGIESIRERLELDEKLINKIFSLHGVPKVLLRNALPVSEAEKLVDKYEITPEYDYELIEENKVQTKEKPWTVKDDQGREIYSLLAPPVVVSLIKQLYNIFVEKN
ncbi:nucleoside monophosphate kinase [Patescibacteria group bacterium]|nr:nucleoside monophosphate kinase [Patescibacteria group bacterium]